MDRRGKGYGTMRDKELNRGGNEIHISVRNVDSLPEELGRLSGSEIMKRLLEGRYPQGVIRRLSNLDFIWLVKKIGEDDSLSLLALGSLAQWQHLFDIEVWEGDYFCVARTAEWLKRLFDADPRRLVRWLFNEGRYLAYAYFYRALEVIIVDPDQDDTLEIPEEFFTLDGVYYVKAADEEYLPVIRDILQVMMDLDYEGYSWFLVNLQGVVPAETEEEMYRLRNVRMAEDGYLPLDEALEAYAPLDLPSLESGGGPFRSDVIDVSNHKIAAPLLPLLYAGEGTILHEVAGRISDTRVIDRLRREFAGLCNQIHVADGCTSHDPEALERTCRKTGGYINMVLEERSGGDPLTAETLVRSNSLLSIFRAGFGLAMQLKWEADRLIEESWFRTRGLPPSFWGDLMGKTLEGLRARRPLFYEGSEAKESYRDFECLSDWGKCRSQLSALSALDRLFERLDHAIPLGHHIGEATDLTFKPLLVTFWARKRLGIDSGYAPVSRDEAQAFLMLLRKGETASPYPMNGEGQSFVHDFMAYATDFDPDSTAALEQSLLCLWHDFVEEYERVASADIVPRYSKLIMIAA